jgi:hypothetical protein
VKRFGAAAALAAALGCRSAPAPVPPAQIVQTAPAVDAGVPAAAEDAAARAAWDAREADPAALERAIDLYKTAAETSANPAPLWLGEARARRALIDRSVQNAREAEIGPQAKACAEAARKSWSARFPGPAEQFVQIGPEGAEALYLDAVCMSLWARSLGFTPLIDRRAHLTAAFERVAQLDPQLDGAGAERELGILYAALPTYAGGDLYKSRAHFDAALKIAPREARTHVALARTVAVKSQDRGLFESELKLAANSDDRFAAADAQRLLEREDDLFGPAEAAQPTPGGTQK